MLADGGAGHPPRPIQAIAVGATLMLALLVAVAIKRAPPDFSALPVIATIRDPAGRALWTIRLARAAHEIAVDGFAVAPPADGQVYRLWLAPPSGAAAGARPLGLLPLAGRRVIPEIPALLTRLAGGGLLVTLAPAGGGTAVQPSGPILFRARPGPAPVPASGVRPG